MLSKGIKNEDGEQKLKKTGNGSRYFIFGCPPQPLFSFPLFLQLSKCRMSSFEVRVHVQYTIQEQEENVFMLMHCRVSARGRRETRRSSG